MNQANISQLFDTKTLQAIEARIASSQYIVITTHVSPDGDALGSSLAMWHYLTRKGKSAKIIVPNTYPTFLKWLPNASEVELYENNPEAAETLLNKADLIFCLDYNIPKRVGAMEQALRAAQAPKILIDHHLFPGDIFEISASYPDMASTSELIFRLFYQLGTYTDMTADEATCIYCGMMTDTGGFTYNSNHPEIYQIISLLLSKGIDKDQIYSNVFHNHSEDRFRLLGFLLSQRMEVYDDCHSALLYLSKADQEQFDVNKGDTEGFVNYPLSIKGIHFSTFIREDNDLVKLSFRSQGTFPCNEFAATYFGGGGHLNASGGEFYGTMEEALAQYHKAMKEFAEKIKAHA